MVEKSVWVWIWMGDLPPPIPRSFPIMPKSASSAPGYQVTEMFRMDIPGNYELLHENLLDVSHITYFIPGCSTMAASARRTQTSSSRPTASPSRATSRRSPMPGTAFAFALEDGKRYRRKLTTWTCRPR